MSDKTKALLDHIQTFNSKNCWDIEGLTQWQLIKHEIQQLELEEIVEVFEASMWLSITSATTNIYEGKKEYPDPLNECLQKLQKFLAVGFWAKIIEIEFSSSDEIKARLKVTEFVGTLPQFSRSAIKNSHIDAIEFPIAHFASACLQQPAPNMFF